MLVHDPATTKTLQTLICSTDHRLQDCCARGSSVVAVPGTKTQASLLGVVVVLLNMRRERGRQGRNRSPALTQCRVRPRGPAAWVPRHTCR